MYCGCKTAAEAACLTALGLGEVVNFSKRTASHLLGAGGGESRGAEVLQGQLGGSGVQGSLARPAPPHASTVPQAPRFSGGLLKGLERGV